MALLQFGVSWHDSPRLSRYARCASPRRKVAVIDGLHGQRRAREMVTLQLGRFRLTTRI
jgi:hypothetical protein